MAAEQVWIVSRGEYADVRALAAFSNPDAAQEWADRWNLNHLGVISGPGDKAVVSGQLPFDPAGADR